MLFKGTTYISEAEAKNIEHHLAYVPKSEDECYRGNISHTVKFDNGMEMKISIGHPDFDPNEKCTPWTEAVLLKDGKELTEVKMAYDYLGEWGIEYKNDVFAGRIEIDKSLQNNKRPAVIYNSNTQNNKASAAIQSGRYDLGIKLQTNNQNTQTETDYEFE